MMEKFQKLFGPNKTQPGAESAQMPFSSAEAPEDAETRRVRNRRRLYGMLVVLAICLAVAPWVMRPNLEFTKSVAEINIPSIPKLTDSARVILQPKNSVALPSVETSAKKTVSAVKKHPEPSASKVETKTVKIASKTVKQENKTKSVEKAAQKKETKQVSVSKVTKAAAKSAATTAAKPAAKISEKPAVQTATTSKTNAKIAAGKAYFIQVMAANTPAAAKAGANKLRALGLPVYIETTKRGGNTFWRVRAGRFATFAEARRALDKLELNGITNLGVMSEKLARK